MGTPICVPSSDFIDIGRIASIEINHKQVDVAKKGQKVAIKVISACQCLAKLCSSVVFLWGLICFTLSVQIVGSNAEEQQKMFGRHFEIDDELVSHISRKSIDILKANYRVTSHLLLTFIPTHMDLHAITQASSLLCSPIILTPTCLS